MVIDPLERVAVGEPRAAEVAREAERHAAGLVEALQLCWLEVDLYRSEVVGQLGLRSDADDRDRWRAPLLRAHPRDRDLAGARAAPLGDRVERVCDRQVTL